MLYGLSSFFSPAQNGWDLSASLEKMKITLIPTTTSYSQTQLNFAIGKNFLTNYSIHGFYTDISTSNASSTTGGNKGSVKGISTSFINSPTSKISFEFDYSLYPVLSTGKTTANEYVLFWDKTLTSTSTYTLVSRLLFESVHPKAVYMTDPISKFVLKTHYERYALYLTLFYSDFQFGLNGWTGAEALGSRNQGGLVFNSLEERNLGYGANVNYTFSPSVALKVSYSNEKAKNATTTTNSSTSVGALTFNF